MPWSRPAGGGPGAAVVLDVQVQPADDEEAAAVSGQGFRQAATI
jgi:hypothetical protein